MPEVSLATSVWVLKDLAKKGAHVHLDTQVKGAVDGIVELSTGEAIPTDVMSVRRVFMANPTVVRGSDLPADDRGRIRTRPDLRVGTDEEIVVGCVGGGRRLRGPRPHGRRRGRLLRSERTARGAPGQADSPRTSRRSSGASFRATTSTRTWRGRGDSASTTVSSRSGKLALKA